MTIIYNRDENGNEEIEANKTASIHVRITQDQLDAFCKAARGLPVDRSNLIRMFVSRVIDDPQRAFKSLVE